MPKLDQLIFFSLCALVFLLPASTAGVGIFTALAILLFVIKKIAGATASVRQGGAWTAIVYPQAAERSLLIPLVFLVGIEFLSMFWSQQPSLSRSAFLGKVVKHLLLYWAVLETINTPRRLKAFLGVLMASAALLCIDGVIQLWTGHDLFKKLPMIEGRVSGAFKHPNGLAAYLVLVLPMIYAAAIAFLGRKSHGVLQCSALMAVFLLGLAALGLTYSRGAWLGFACAVMALTWIEKKRAIMVFAAFALFLFVFIPLLRMERNVSLVTEQGGLDKTAAIEAIASSRDDDWIDRWYERLVKTGLGGSDRLIFWHDALKIIQDHPWTGTGLNTYSATVKKYSESRAYYPHNCYLQITGELGPFGLLIFLWFLAAHLVFGWRMRTGMDAQMAIVWAGILAGFIGFCVHAFFDTIFYSVQHGALLWIFLGILAAGRMISMQKREDGLQN